MSALKQKMRRRLVVAAGFVFGGLTFMLVITGVQISAMPVTGTEGLIAQQNMLVGTLQGALGLVIALSTIYYAGKTADMAVSMRAEHEASRQRSIDAAVGNLIGSALEAGTVAGRLAPMMRRRWRLPGARRTRDQLMIGVSNDLSRHLSSALRWSEEVAYLDSSLRSASDAVVDAAVDAHDVAMHGNVDDVHGAVRGLRARTDQLREQMTVSSPSEQVTEVRSSPARRQGEVGRVRRLRSGILGRYR